AIELEVAEQSERGRTPRMDAERLAEQILGVGRAAALEREPGPHRPEPRRAFGVAGLLERRPLAEVVKGFALVAGRGEDDGAQREMFGERGAVDERVGRSERAGHVADPELGGGLERERAGVPGSVAE